MTYKLKTNDLLMNGTKFPEQETIRLSKEDKDKLNFLKNKGIKTQPILRKAILKALDEILEDQAS